MSMGRVFVMLIVASGRHVSASNVMSSCMREGESFSKEQFFLETNFVYF
jgi:hypothetical protein